jgi:hypothetical protein
MTNPDRIWITTPAYGILYDAFEQTGDWTTEFDRMLTRLAEDLAAMHPASACDLAEDCPGCPSIRGLGDLAHAYHHLRTELINGTGTTGATA